LGDRFVLGLGQEFVLRRAFEVDEAGSLGVALEGAGIESVEFGEQVIPRRVRQPAVQQPVDEGRDPGVAGAWSVGGRQDAFGDRIQGVGLVLREHAQCRRFAGGRLLRVQVQMGDVWIREEFRRQERQCGSAANNLEGAPAAEGLGRFLAWRTCHRE